MNDRFRSFFAAGGVVVGCASVYGGLMMRSRVDLDGSTLTASASNSVMSTWVASRDEDVNVPALDYYGRMVGLLKEYYVEPIKDDEKLASGSVRGMVTSLGDPRSLFMDRKVFRAYVDRQNGIYEGVGADFYLDVGGPRGKSAQSGLEPPPESTEEAVARLPQVPKLVVGAVAPGGPADRAGVRPGDVVTDIDGHWVVDEGLLGRFRVAQRLFLKRKITFSQIAPLQKELRHKIQRALLPVRAAERLEVGTEGPISVTWTRNGVTRTTRITKEKCRMAGFGLWADSIRLPMTDAAAEQLPRAIAGKRMVTIDLRNDPVGSFGAAIKCLQALAPSGAYGEFITNRHEPASPLLVSSGNPAPPKITLLVDRTTRGPAEILALALSSRGKAVLKGSEMGGDLNVLQTVELPDGTGYSLVTSEYRAANEKKALVAGRRRS